MLAGVVLPFDRGPLGHSDGDVVCHALVDAMLGILESHGADHEAACHFPGTPLTDAGTTPA